MPELKTSPPAKFEWTNEIANQVEKHLNEIEKNVNDQQGKKGFNPYIWIVKCVNPLVDRLTGQKFSESEGRKISVEPERTEELYKAIMALPTVPPKPKMSIDEAPTEYNIKQQDIKPLGLNIPDKR